MHIDYYLSLVCVNWFDSNLSTPIMVKVINFLMCGQLKVNHLGHLITSNHIWKFIMYDDDFKEHYEKNGPVRDVPFLKVTEKVLINQI